MFRIYYSNDQKRKPRFHSSFNTLEDAQNERINLEVNYPNSIFSIYCPLSWYRENGVDIDLKKYIETFMERNPTNEEIECFYIHEVMPYDKRSINEILEEE